MTAHTHLFGVLPLETDPAVIGAALGHDRGLVALSMLTALAFAYGFLELAGQSRRQPGAVGVAWRAAGGALLGLGVWATHFIGMLALDTPLLRGISLEAGLWSCAFGIGCGVAALTIAAPRAGVVRFTIAGLLIAFGALAMHYWDVLAVEIDADLRFRPEWMAATAVGAFMTAVITVPVAYRLRNSAQRLLMALPMAAVIAGLHYVDMAATIAVPTPSFAPPPAQENVTTALIIAAAVAAASAAAFFVSRRPAPTLPQPEEAPSGPALEVTGDPIVILPRRRADE